MGQEESTGRVMKRTHILNFYFFLLPIILFPPSFEVALDNLKNRISPTLVGCNFYWPEKLVLKLMVREKNRGTGERKRKIEQEKSRPFKNTHC